jgi:FHS family L-fucose permease-like MFS transporter
VSVTTAALITSGFWSMLTGGRLLGALLGARLAPETLLLASLGGGTIGALLLAFSTGDPLLTTVAVLLLGLCFAPVYPTTVAIITATFRHAAGTATSIVVALGSVGGMVLPLLQGVLLERSGPQSSVVVIVAGTCAMLACFLGYRWLAVRRAQGESPTA